jgi:hypothetical protein
MSDEKVQAFFESMLAMGRQVMRTNQEYAGTAMAQWMRVWMTPWWVAAYRPLSQTIAALPRTLFGPTRAQQQKAVSRLIEQGLAPVHKRATANARRLSAVKARSK